MIEWYNNKYANFKGRATRSEYGIWLLFMLLMFFVVSLLATVTNNILARTLNYKTLFFLLFIPFQAVTIRRIRDLGHNGGFVFFNFVPYVNFIFVFILLILKGENKTNAYGENPYISETITE